MSLVLLRVKFLSLISLACFLKSVAASPEPAPDIGWPRVFERGDKRLTIHQPQVDSWTGFTNLTFKCAIAVKTANLPETFGVAEVDAQTVTDHEAGTVTIFGKGRTLRFANVGEKDLGTLRATVDEIYPTGQVTVLAIERVLAYLDVSRESEQRTVNVNLNPPRIFTSSRASILVSFMGKPQFRPVDTNRTDLEFAVNCNWDILLDTQQQQFYLLKGDSWLSTKNLLEGPWDAAGPLPKSINSLPKDENWSEILKNVPGKTLSRAPTVFVTTRPAELIVLDGPPKYTPIAGTKLQRVSNTSSVLFLDSTNQRFYFLVAGRWFRADGLSGPWTSASENLPADFALIPDNDPSAVVKVSVPGTTEAKDAVLLASIPITTTVDATNANINLAYSGEPEFQPISDTGVQYAINSPAPVFLVEGIYYTCQDGCFFNSNSPNGPWTPSSQVPPAIYKIPPSHPMHFVTYVTVEESTPESVSFNQTGGYRFEYVAPTGVLMYGAGENTVEESEAENSRDDSYYYWYIYPGYYTYGIGATYYYGYGGFYGPSYHTYGPYGGVSVFAGYNPYTGAYMRSGSAYGLYAQASRTAIYHPDSGAIAAHESASTPTRSASRAAAYNPVTGEGAVGVSRESRYGSAAALKTTQGSVAAWSTKNGQGVAAKTATGNIYAAADGNVYMRDANGTWWRNSGNGWQNTLRPQPVATPGANRQTQIANGPQQRPAGNMPAKQQDNVQQDLERQANMRQAANRQAARANHYRASGRGVSRPMVVRGRR